MATSNSPQVVIIAKDGDLTLRLYKIEKKGETFQPISGGEEIPGRILATMKVSRQVLIENSRPFKIELTGECWKESQQTTVDMEVDSIPAVEVAMCVIHNSLKTEIEDMEIKDIWELIQYCKYRELSIEQFENWFGNLMWKKEYKKLKTEEMVKLLFPAYTFNHSPAFAFFTKHLAYRVSTHIMEVNPTPYHHLHLDGNDIGSLNGAKGSLRSKLVRGLCDPLGDFAEGMSCRCRAESLLSYTTALTKTGLWPLQDHHKKPVLEILNSPGLANFTCEVPKGACPLCRYNLANETTQTVRHDVLKHFDGLCLDCMKQTKSGDIDSDYWDHDMRKAWSSSCDITHGQATWYFSFMGRKTDMSKHMADKKKRWEESSEGSDGTGDA